MIIAIRLGLLACVAGGQPVPPGTEPSARPVAIVDDVAITWNDVRPALCEAAGAAVLADAVLDARLARRAAARNITVVERDLARERDLLLERLPAQDADRAAELLAALRRARGLGDARFPALLRRNALLRALVSDRVLINEAVLRQAYAVKYGPRTVARVIAVATQQEAAEIHQAIARAAAAARSAAAAPDDESVPAWVFGQFAAERSRDASAVRAGQLEPFSLDDPDTPAALRSAAATLAVGRMSRVLALDSGFAILLVTGRTPAADVPFESVRDALEAEIRLRQQRMLMQDLAERLLAEPGVSVMDRDLGWAWRSRAGAVAP
ncbi:MAG: peptidyl-prolyl cis-trans isomerase [Phycisphaeraceae bacterium]|nr:peptidyl-prolyl cis-trans isomerase [Phycisphaeraceae bacterium]